MGFFSNISDSARVARFLLRISNTNPSTSAPAGVEESLDLLSGSGATFDLYAPIEEPLATTIAVHGMTINGNKDARLIGFARSLAEAGVACLVPTLPGLASCSLTNSDLEALSGVISDAFDKYGHPVSIVGFSYGGSYALLAACQGSLSNQVRYVLTFGAYHSLKDLFRWYMENRNEEPSDQLAWDRALYLRISLANRFRSELGLDETFSMHAEELLRRYCNDSSLEEKRRFYEERLQGLDVLRTAYEESDPVVWEELSPAGKIGGLRCRVSLIHDRSDTIVPPSHSEKLYSELRERQTDDEGAHDLYLKHELLVTSLLSHVSVGDMTRVGELRRMFSAVAPVLSDV